MLLFTYHHVIIVGNGRIKFKYVERKNNNNNLILVCDEQRGQLVEPRREFTVQQNSRQALGDTQSGNNISILICLCI